MFELTTELEVDFPIEDGRIVSSLLQGLQEAIDFSADVCFLGLEILLDLALDGVDCMLDLASADLSLVVFRIDGHPCEQLLHEIDKHIVISFLVLDVLNGQKQLIILASLQFDLVEYLNEDGVDIISDAFQRLLDVLLKVIEGEHQLASGFSDGGLHLFDIKSERRQSFEVLLGVANDQLERAYLMVAMLLVVADAAYHALLNALGLKADHVQDLADVTAALRALGVSELLTGHSCRERFIISNPT